MALATASGQSAQFLAITNIMVSGDNFVTSSSIYGANKRFPFREIDRTDHQISFYAATKKCNELMAYSYSNIYKLPITGMRFFTVYGLSLIHI